jgi:hypothetical protein
VNALLAPGLNAWLGGVIAAGAAVWTVLSILLTSEPANVLAMSGVALVGFGLQLIQGSLQMRKLEVTNEETS